VKRKLRSKKRGWFGNHHLSQSVPLQRERKANLRNCGVGYRDYHHSRKVGGRTTEGGKRGGEKEGRHLIRQRGGVQFT